MQFPFFYCLNSDLPTRLDTAVFCLDPDPVYWKDLAFYDQLFLVLYLNYCVFA